MNRSKKTIAVCGVLVLIAGLTGYLIFAGRSDNAAAEDARNLQALREEVPGGPPPVSYNDLPAKPSNGTRETLE